MRNKEGGLRCLFGCGPGTNAPPAHANTRESTLVMSATFSWRGTSVIGFSGCRCPTSDAIPAGSYDFILVNSFLHHIDTPDAQRVLSRASEFLTADGHLHSVELVLPEKTGIPRWLALHDRGKFPRSLSTWREIFTDKLETVIFEPFAIRHLGQTIMELVYFKGRVKR